MRLSDISNRKEIALRFRTLWLCLILLFTMIAPVVAADDQKLIRLGSEAYRAGEYEKCAEHYSAAIANGAHQPDVFYNAACCYALSGQIDQAFLSLDKAIDNGYRQVNWLGKDTDLQSLRADIRWSPLVAGCQAAYELYLQSINSELYGIYREDQDDRLTGTADIDWSRVRERDAEHRARVTEMLDSGQVTTADDYYHAAMVFQHGEDATAYLLAHELALKAVALDSTLEIARWLSAAAKDRYLWEVGEPQWYGTQLHMLEGVWTIEPIDSTIVTDEERLRWSVPTLAEARRRAAQMNENTSN